MMLKADKFVTIKIEILSCNEYNSVAEISVYKILIVWMLIQTPTTNLAEGARERERNKKKFF